MPVGSCESPPCSTGDSRMVSRTHPALEEQGAGVNPDGCSSSLPDGTNESSTGSEQAGGLRSQNSRVAIGLAIGSQLDSQKGTAATCGEGWLNVLYHCSGAPTTAVGPVATAMSTHSTQAAADMDATQCAGIHFGRQSLKEMILFGHHQGPLLIFPHQIRRLSNV